MLIAFGNRLPKIIQRSANNMKILHIIFGGAFNEEMSYQGSILPKENRKSGHEVIIIASCYKWDQGKIVKVREEDRVTNDGIRVIRLEFDNIINESISRRIRKCKKLMKYINDIKPDVIFHHDIQGFTLFTVAKYKKENPNIKLYVDSHTDLNNSASNWISLNLQHKLFHKTIAKLTVKYFEKIFYVSYEARDFLIDIYNIPEKKLEFYPLGGLILSKKDKLSYRREKRYELGISENDILLCHSGKMDSLKRTYEILYYFNKVKNENLKLILIGVFSEDVKEKVMPLIQQDDRIIYLGWKSSDELIKYIAASDLYLQPGSQSATMQISLCSGTPVLFANVKSHEVYMKGNAFAINNFDEMESIFHKICEEPDILKEMSDKAYLLASDLLDYRKMADRITR